MKEKIKLVPIKETEKVYRKLRETFPDAYYVSLDLSIPWWAKFKNISKVEYKAYMQETSEQAMCAGHGETPLQAFEDLLKRIEQKKTGGEKNDTAAQ